MTEGKHTPDGGPAFPTEPNTQPGLYQHHGMTLRDYFAAQALIGLLAHGPIPRGQPIIGGTPMDYETAAYALADAMLAERSK